MVGGGPLGFESQGYFFLVTYCPGHMRTKDRLLTAQGLGLLLLSLPFCWKWNTPALSEPSVEGAGLLH